MSARNNLSESENQLVARYTGGLKEIIQDKLGLNSMWTLSQAVNFALKVEAQLHRPYRSQTTRRSFHEGSLSLAKTSGTPAKN